MGLWAICGQFGGNMKANKEAARLGNMKIQTSRQHKFNTNMWSISRKYESQKRSRKLEN